MKYFRVWIKYFVDSGSITNLDCKRIYAKSDCNRSRIVEKLFKTRMCTVCGKCGNLIACASREDTFER